MKDHIIWSYLSSNTEAIDMLEQNQIFVHWINISSNANIFEYDYEGMKYNTSSIRNEFIKRGIIEEDYI